VKNCSCQWCFAIAWKYSSYEERSAEKRYGVPQIKIKVNLICIARSSDFNRSTAKHGLLHHAQAAATFSYLKDIHGCRLRPIFRSSAKVQAFILQAKVCPIETPPFCMRLLTCAARAEGMPLEALDSPCTRTASARIPRCIQSEAFWDHTANLTRICSRFRSRGRQCIAKRVIHFQSNRCTGTRIVLPNLDLGFRVRV
jgi:hypothetical protein